MSSPGDSFGEDVGLRKHGGFCVCDVVGWCGVGLHPVRTLLTRRLGNRQRLAEVVSANLNWSPLGWWLAVTIGRWLR